MKYSFLLFVLIFMSCSAPAPEVKLSSTDYKNIDSLLKVKKRELNVEIDSICKVINKVEYEKAVDSIAELREKDIKEILNN